MDPLGKELGLITWVSPRFYMVAPLGYLYFSLEAPGKWSEVSLLKTTRNGPYESTPVYKEGGVQLDLVVGIRPLSGPNTTLGSETGVELHLGSTLSRKLTIPSQLLGSAPAWVRPGT